VASDAFYGRILFAPSHERTFEQEIVPCTEHRQNEERHRHAVNRGGHVTEDDVISDDVDEGDLDELAPVGGRATCRRHDLVERRLLGATTLVAAGGTTGTGGAAGSPGDRSGGS